MSSEHEFLFPLQTGFSSSLPSFELFLCFLLFLSLVSFFLSPGGLAWAIYNNLLKKTDSKKAIPGPSGLPLLGLVHAFTHNSLTHKILAKLAQKFKAKPLMSFSVGLTRFVISSNPETAKELLNNSAFADRPIKESAYELLFHRAMGFAPYGEYWRNLRRISATHLFSPKKIAFFGDFRQKVGLKMVEEIQNLMEKNGEVEVRKVLHFGSLNNVMICVFGKSYEFGHEGCDGLEVLEELVSEGYDLLGRFNWSDHFCFLGWFDFQGLRKRCKKLVEKVNVFVAEIIEEHRMRRVENNKNYGGRLWGESSGDFVDVLLDLEEENRLSDSDIIAVLWEMIFRGTDTVAILLEWILARMVLHPEIQSKVQSEIDITIPNNRPIVDSDLPNLPYLRAVVKETLRMHPPGPLLSWARLAIHDTHIGPHFVPAGSTAMVNMWSITHDEQVWSDPFEFKPERFMEDEYKDFGIMGSDLRLAPFGSGRRVCPGKAMGLVSVELWLAQLLQKFKWMKCDGDDDHGVDLSECLKLSLEMKNSLVCKAVARV